MSRQIAVFYHVWTSENLAISQFLVDEQIRRIRLSGLNNVASIHCCVSGRHHAAIAEFLQSYEWVNIVESVQQNNSYEGFTLKRLFDYVRTYDQIEYVAYLHTKGIQALSNPTMDEKFRKANSWRHFLEWGTIDNWRTAILLLGKYDAVGVNFKLRPWSHFSGNFWWATASYIRRLACPVAENVPNGGFGWIDEQQALTDEKKIAMKERLFYERWIGLNDPKTYSFYGWPNYTNSSGFSDYDVDPQRTDISIDYLNKGHFCGGR